MTTAKIKFYGKEYEVPDVIYVWEYETIENEDGEEEFHSNGYNIYPSGDEGEWISCEQYKINQEEAEELLSSEVCSKDYGGICGASIEGLWLEGREVVINIDRSSYQILYVPTIEDLDGWAGWSEGCAENMNLIKHKIPVFTLHSDYDKNHRIVVAFNHDANTRNKGMKQASENIQEAVNDLRRRHYPRCGNKVYTKNAKREPFETWDLERLMAEVRLTGTPSENEEFLDWATNQLQVLADKIYSMYWWHEDCPIK